MDVKPKYTEAGYDIDEDFVESIQQFDIRTGQKIAEFIQKNVNDIELSPPCVQFLNDTCERFNPTIPLGTHNVSFFSSVSSAEIAVAERITKVNSR